MEKRDWELLDKQVRHLQPPTRQESTMVAVLVGVFLIGATFGGMTVFASGEPMRVASSDQAPSSATLADVFMR